MLAHPATRPIYLWECQEFFKGGKGEEMERTRVRKVDDLDYTQQGLRELLELAKNLEVAARAGKGREAVHLLSRGNIARWVVRELPVLHLQS